MSYLLPDITLGGGRDSWLMNANKGMSDTHSANFTSSNDKGFTESIGG
jgi:hypothetical protein